MNMLWKSLILLLNISCFQCAVKFTCSEDLCFYTNGLPVSSLSEAQLQCKQNGSKLLELSEERIEKVFDDVYKTWTDGDNEFVGYYVWLNLKSNTFDWTWINGIKYSGINDVGFSYNNENYAIITCDSANGKVSFRGSSFNRDLPFICSSDGCEDSTCVSFHNSTSMNWFDARYKCFKMGKDLAVLNWVTNFSKDLPDLQLYSGQEFWLGLTRREFKWQDSSLCQLLYIIRVKIKIQITIEFHNSDVVLKYANWFSGQPANSGCVIISNITSYQWITSECTSQNHIVICLNYTSPNDNLKSTSSAEKTLDTHEPHLPVTTSTGSSSSAATNPQPQHLAIGLGVGIPLLILLITSIIVGVCLFRKKSTKRNSDFSRNFTNILVEPDKDQISQQVIYDEPEIIINTIITNQNKSLYSPVVSNQKKVANERDADLENSKNSLKYAEVDFAGENCYDDFNELKISNIPGASMPDYATIDKNKK